MSLTSEEQTKILFYLGYSGNTIVPDTTDYSNIITRNLVAISTATEEMARNLLVRLEKVDTALQNAICRLSAKRVDQIELNPDEIMMLRKERTSIAKELASLLDIPYTGKSGTNVCVVV